MAMHVIELTYSWISTGQRVEENKPKLWMLDWNGGKKLKNALNVVHKFKVMNNQLKFYTSKYTEIYRPICHPLLQARNNLKLET